MVASTFKQRELREREDIFLDVALELLRTSGFQGLTMERIARPTEYSKGTVYMHFGCKEEVVLALAKRSMRRRNALLQRAAAFQGRPRERMVAVGEAIALSWRLYPDDPLFNQIINAEAIIQKAPAESVHEMRALAHRGVGMVIGIVRDAVAQGDLELGTHTSPDEIAFALWAMTDGTSLITRWIGPGELEIADPFASIMRSAEALGDGFGWRPLSSEWDYEQTRERVRTDVFPEEVRKAARM